MRRLLVLGVVVAGLIGVSGTLEAAYPYDTWLYLYHPTGSGTSQTARLECGWHTDCETFIGDNLAGLDWTWTTGSHSVRFRVKAIAWDTNQQVTVAYADAVHLEPPQIFCEKTNVELQRTIDGALYGTVEAANDDGTFYDLAIRGGPGLVDTNVYVGEMVNPNDENCNGSGYWHTMQSYYSGPLDYSWTRNGPPPNGYLPSEGYCNWSPYDQNGNPDQCPKVYSPWSAWEYLVKFYAY